MTIVVNKVNKKTMMVSLEGDWKGHQNIDGKFYPVTCNDTEYIPDLSVNIFSVMRVDRIQNSL